MLLSFCTSYLLIIFQVTAASLKPTVKISPAKTEKRLPARVYITVRHRVTHLQLEHSYCSLTQHIKTQSEQDARFYNRHHPVWTLCVSVFQVKVLSVSQSYYDKYEMEITQVIKLGESLISKLLLPVIHSVYLILRVYSVLM